MRLNMESLKPYRGMLIGAVLALGFFAFLSFSGQKTQHWIRDSPVANWSRYVEKRALFKGVKAPEFVLANTEEYTLSSQHLVGKEWVVVFVTSVCPHCNNLFKKIQEIKSSETSLLLICEDGSQGAQKIKEKYQISVPVLIDSLNLVSQAFRVTNVPHLYLVDKSGKILGSATGEPAVWEVLEKKFLLSNFI